MKINVRLLFVTSTITTTLSLVAMVVIAPLPTVTAHHSQSRTLAIVFDVTFSMIADLEHLKFVIADIFKDITENLDRRYSDYLFLAFHDPVIGLPLSTTNRTIFLDMIQQQYAFPIIFNEDCEEMCLPAIYSAMFHVHNKSDIFVFTDDNSKHRELLPRILQEIEYSKPKISFIMTPGCNFRNLDDTYEEIASASGGQIYETVKKNVTALVTGLSKHLAHDWRQLLKMDFHTGGTHQITLNLDNEELVLLSLTGKNANFKLFNPMKKEVEVAAEEIVAMQNIKEIVLKSPEAGEWELELSGDSVHRLRVFSVPKPDDSAKYFFFFIAYCVIVSLIIALCFWKYQFFVESYRKVNKYFTTHPVRMPRCCGV